MLPPCRCCAYIPETRWSSTRCLPTVPRGLEKAGVPPEQVEQSLRDIYKEVTDKGPGGHILNGPVFVEEAEPGDTLEIRIQKIDLAIPYAYNGFGPNRAVSCRKIFPIARSKIIPLDRERMVAKFAPGIEIPLHPFFGSMGVAPPEASGRDGQRSARHSRRQHGQQRTRGRHNAFFPGACQGRAV